MNYGLCMMHSTFNHYTQKGLTQAIHFMDLGQPFFMILLKAFNLLIKKS